MKNDHVREMKREPHHTYTKPIDHIVCPILVLGIDFIILSTGNKYAASFPQFKSAHQIHKILPLSVGETWTKMVRFVWMQYKYNWSL